MHRKTVTVVFCDVVGSTALGERTDPEALQALLARYFDQMQAIVERHGGSVEKFIGDAVMAVFGVPAVHEDDALRATRAAWEMRAAFGDLEVQGRIGMTLQARVDAARGDHDAAELMAVEGVRRGLETDQPTWQGDAWRDLAEVRLAAGRDGDAADAFEEALACYLRKGNLAMAAQVRPSLASVRAR